MRVKGVGLGGSGPPGDGGVGVCWRRPARGVLLIRNFP